MTASAREEPSICFVAPKAYPLLSQRTDLRHIGGAEVQQLLIARELVARGWRVTFVTLDHGQPDGVRHDGIQVFKTYRPHAGLPGLRFFHPRWSCLLGAMRRARATVYYQRNNGAETGQAAYWCRRQRRRFVFAVSSMTNCLPQLPGLPTLRERWLYRYGLRRADSVVVQTEQQAALMASNFRVTAVVINSCCPTPAAANLPESAAPPPRRIVWVGRNIPEKRLDWFVEMARALPSVQCDVVGVNQEALGSIAVPPNLDCLGPLPYHVAARSYANARLLVSTSSIEGFPNTFLEAWSHGVPVVSTVDPGGIISSQGLGAVGDSIPELTRAAARLIEDGEYWRAASMRSRDYCRAHHSIASVCDAYETLLSNLGVTRVHAT